MTSLSTHITPILAITGYLVYPTQLRINSSVLYYLSVAHNSFLVTFSTWTCFSLSKILYESGLVFRSNYYFQNPQFDRIIYLFYISKYYEFFDTFLMYLNNKKPIFLQKYHHIGAVINWHLTYVYKVDAILYVTLFNSFVHTIMYSYYLGCLLKFNQVKVIKKYITTIQILQFVSLLYNAYLYRPPIETWFNYSLIMSFALYTVGLIVLFAKFYSTTYKND